MNSKLTMIITSSLAALALSANAHASISASIEQVCDQADAESSLLLSSQLVAKREYANTLTAHFNATSCEGKQLLEQIKLVNSLDQHSGEQPQQVVKVTN